MRTPTTLQARWEWYEARISGEERHTSEHEIQCGFFKVRKFPYGLWPTGPWIPARIWMADGETDEIGELLTEEKWFAEIDGKRVDPWRTWTWLSKHPVTEAEWLWLTALSPLLPKSLPKPKGR